MSGCGPGTRVVSELLSQRNGNDGTASTETEPTEEATGDDPAAVIADEAAELCAALPEVEHPPNAATTIVAPSQSRDTLMRLRRGTSDDGCAMRQENTRGTHARRSTSNRSEAILDQSNPCGSCDHRRGYADRVCEFGHEAGQRDDSECRQRDQSE
jgi:hypothetical protein